MPRPPGTRPQWKPPKKSPQPKREPLLRAPAPEEHLSQLLKSEVGIDIPPRHITKWSLADRIRVWQIVARIQMAGQAQCDVPWPMACLSGGN